MTDQLAKAYSYGNVPANVGYDPHWGWRWACTKCGSSGALLARQVSRRIRGQVKAGFKSRHLCSACHGGVRKVIYKLSRAEAFHRNDILWRSTNLDKSAAISGF